MCETCVDPHFGHLTDSCTRQPLVSIGKRSQGSESELPESATARFQQLDDDRGVQSRVRSTLPLPEDCSPHSCGLSTNRASPPARGPHSQPRAEGAQPHLATSRAPFSTSRTRTTMDEPDFDSLLAEAEQDSPQPSPSPPQSPPRPCAPEIVKRPGPPVFTPLTPSSYLPSLNENQRKAVQHSPDGGLQILAGPGSGTPFVVCARLAAGADL